METLELTPRPIDPAAYIGRIPVPGEWSRLIRRDTRLVVDGRVIAVYVVLPDAITEPMRRVALTAEMSEGMRTHGLPVRSAIFGALPRIAIRQNYCRMTASSLKEAGHLEVVQRFSLTLSEIYARELPVEFERNLALVADQVEPDYILRPPEERPSPFTSCNFNLNHAIRYHQDTGNFRGVFSNVLILKRGVVGGFLVCPAFDLAFEQSDNALILFDGQAIVHGVTPIRRTNPHGYRCSTVFYALEAMRDCYPFAEELQRAREWRTGAEGHFRPDPAAVAWKRGNPALDRASRPRSQEDHDGE
jgi:hypothetical protein